MTNNDEMALKLGNLAVKATGGEWSAFVDVRSKTFAIHTPEDNTCSDIIKWAGFDGQKKAKANAEFIATASPANILALLAERDADKKRIAELEQKADIYDMLRADYELEGSLVDFVDWQAKRIEMLELYTTERDAQNQDLLLNIGSLQQRIAELEARTVSVKLPENTPLAEAPEHIWLQTAGVWPENGEFSELTWCSDNQHRDDTLYVRADLAAGINLEVGE